MHRAFNLAECNWSKTPDSREALNLVAKNDNAVKKALDCFLDKTKGVIDGAKMRDHWFPEISADVFISHSHRDQTDARKLAGYLKRHFELDSFIDSCVWGYADDLLKQIDGEHCWDKDRQVYRYEQRNSSTSHVHMMLASALGKMLDVAECIIFMKTPNSITTDEPITTTLSPWIYYELGLMSLIQKRPIEDYRKHLIKESSAKRLSSFSELKIAYPAPLGELTQIGAPVFGQWLEAWKSDKAKNPRAHSLDSLYRIAREEPTGQE